MEEPKIVFVPDIEEDVQTVEASVTVEPVKVELTPVEVQAVELTPVEVQAVELTPVKPVVVETLSDFDCSRCGRRMVHGEREVCNDCKAVEVELTSVEVEPVKAKSQAPEVKAPKVKRAKRVLGIGRGGDRPDPASKRYTDERLHLLIDQREKWDAQEDAVNNDVSFANWVRIALRRMRGATLTDEERGLLRTQGAKPRRSQDEKKGA